MIDVTLDLPSLEARFAGPMRCLSWAPVRIGTFSTEIVLWKEGRHAGLKRDFDALFWLAGELSAREAPGGVAMLTSRDLAENRLKPACSGHSSAVCTATIGLSNAEHIRDRQFADPAPVGKINMLVIIDAARTDVAMIEAISIATGARTAAVIDSGPELRAGRAAAAGTGCIVLACPAGATAPSAGLDTVAGEALGRACYTAVSKGARAWMRTEHRP